MLRKVNTDSWDGLPLGYVNGLCITLTNRELFPLHQLERKRNVLRGRQRDHRDEHSLSSIFSTPSFVTGGGTEDSGNNFSVKCASPPCTRATGQPPPRWMEQNRCRGDKAEKGGAGSRKDDDGREKTGGK